MLLSFIQYVANFVSHLDIGSNAYCVFVKYVNKPLHIWISFFSEASVKNIYIYLLSRNAVMLWTPVTPTEQMESLAFYLFLIFTSGIFMSLYTFSALMLNLWQKKVCATGLHFQLLLSWLYLRRIGLKIAGKCQKGFKKEVPNMTENQILNYEVNVFSQSSMILLTFGFFSDICCLWAVVESSSRKYNFEVLF